MIKRNLAGGLGGKEPENMWTRELPENRPKKRRCRECGVLHLLRYLSDPKEICIDCREEELEDARIWEEEKKEQLHVKLEGQRLHNLQITGLKETNQEREERERKEQLHEKLEEQRIKNLQITGLKETNQEREEREKRELILKKYIDDIWRKIYYNPHRINLQYLNSFLVYPIDELIELLSSIYPNFTGQWSIEKIKKSFNEISKSDVFQDINRKNKLEKLLKILKELYNLEHIQIEKKMLENGWKTSDINQKET